MSRLPHLFFNRAGEPIEQIEWLRLFNEPGYGLVASDTVNGVQVVTGWTGTAMPRLDGGPPTYFETFVRGVELEPMEYRYASEAEALAGHAKTLEAVRKAVS